MENIKNIAMKAVFLVIVPFLFFGVSVYLFGKCLAGVFVDWFLQMRLELGALKRWWRFLWQM